MKRKKITVTQKRWLVSAHILSISIWFGTTVCFMILMLIATRTNDQRTLNMLYSLVETLDISLIWPSSLATLATGALLAILTQWGLIRFYWIILKEVLTLLAIALGMVGLHPWLLFALTATSTQEGSMAQKALLTMNQHKQFAGITFQLLAMTLMVVISIFKPWGQRRQTIKMVATRQAK